MINPLLTKLVWLEMAGYVIFSFVHFLCIDRPRLHLSL